MKPAGELWTTQDVGDQLGFSRRTIQRWTKEGKLGALVYRVGVRPALRYRPEDVAAFAARYVSELGRDEEAGG